MKIFSKIIFLTFILISAQNVSSQEAIKKEPCNEGTTEYNVRYNKLKAMYIELQSKESTKEYLALTKAFKDKANYEGTVKDIVEKSKGGVNAINEWVRNNIDKTDFKDLNEAEAEIGKILSLNQQIILENRVLYSYFIETYNLCVGLTEKLFLELGNTYGTNFRY